MSYNRKSVAAGFLIGILIVALLLRIKFYFDPPEVGDVSAVTSYFSAALLSGIEPPADTNIDLSAVINSTTGEAIPVEPMAVTEAVVRAVETKDLVTGLQPTVAQWNGEYLLGFLFEQRYVVKRYDPAWTALQEDDTTLTDDLNLIQGELPMAILSVINGELYLLYTKPTSDNAEVLLKQFATPTELKGSYPLLIDVDTTTALEGTIGSDFVAISQTPVDSTTATLSFFSLAGQLQTERELSDHGTIRALIPDEKAVIVVSTTADEVLFAKISSLGEITQEVSMPLSEASVLVTAERLGDLLALQTDSAVLLFSDNLTKWYPSIELMPEQLYSDLFWDGQRVLLTFNTATSLTEYAVHVNVYQRVQ